MCRGKGELTYHQLKTVHQLDQAEKESLRKQVAKLQADYRALCIAHNKLREKAKVLDAVPQLNGALGIAGAISGSVGRYY